MCAKCSRRGFVQMLIAGMLFPKPSLATPANFPTACAFDQTGYNALDFPRKAQSGNVNLDNALIAELRRITTIIPVHPGFQYIEERSPNAFATPQTIIPGTSGTVLIGLKLVTSFLQTTNGGAVVAGVCAHECGHIYQFFSEYNEHFENSNNKLVLRELHADFIAGYYMGKRREYTADNVRLFTQTLIQFGTYDFADPKYHGSPAIRAAAMEGGYHMAITGDTFGDAVAKGENYVRRLPL
jgi:hypothetical protein